MVSCSQHGTDVSKNDGNLPGESRTSRRGALRNVPTPCRASRNAGNTLEDLMKKKGVDEATSALEEMQRQGVATDKFTVSRIIMKTVGDGKGKLNSNRIYRAIAAAEKFIEMQPQDVDEVLFNALLDTCCRLKDLERLEATVKRMRELKVTPSPVTLGILVKTYGQAGDLQKVLQAWEEMEKQRHQANAVTYGCMIDACVKCGNLDKAVEIFEDMRKNGKHRNTILYTTLIKGYGLVKDLNRALSLFREMPKEGVPYNTITYNSMVDACVKCGDLQTAEELLREVTAPGSSLEPDLITFSTLLKGYCHIGDLDKALQVAEAIKQRGLRCDELVYNTLMDGCVKANDFQVGIGLFEEMVHQGMRPSAITHSILARLHQRAGYEENASEAVAQLYEHHQIDRPHGGDRGKTSGRRAWNARVSNGFSDRSNDMSTPETGIWSSGPWAESSSQNFTDLVPQQGMVHNSLHMNKQIANPNKSMVWTNRGQDMGNPSSCGEIWSVAGWTEVMPMSTYQEPTCTNRHTPTATSNTGFVNSPCTYSDFGPAPVVSQHECISQRRSMSEVQLGGEPQFFPMDASRGSFFSNMPVQRIPEQGIAQMQFNAFEHQGLMQQAGCVVQMQQIPQMSSYNCSNNLHQQVLPPQGMCNVPQHAQQVNMCAMPNSGTSFGMIACTPIVHMNNH